MKRLLYSTVILVFIFNSCVKDQKDSKPSNNDTTYTIYYKNFIPDTLIKTNSNSEPSLDLNNDSIMDIRFNEKLWIVWSGPHPVDCHSIGISANDSLKFIFKTSCMLSCDGPSDTTMYININDSIKKYFALEYVSLNWECHCFASKKYIGFILQKNGIKYLGWIQLEMRESSIIIDDFATLKSSTDSIRIGVH
jgi:hypothetical protein